MSKQIQNWKTLDSKYAYQHNWFGVRVDKCELPDGRIMEPYYIVEIPDWCNVIVATDKEELIMVQQYRYAAGIITIEPPGGIIEKYEQPIDAAIREMQEETGYISDQIDFLCEIYPNPALQKTKAFFYLARNARKAANAKLDEFEDLNTVTLSKQKVLGMLAESQFKHAAQTGALYKAVIQLGWL
jgi:ADP-ribose pyrophosphatase